MADRAVREALHRHNAPLATSSRPRPTSRALKIGSTPPPCSDQGLPGDVASLSISRRDAGDRVAGITDPVQLQRLLAQAVRSGDDVLSRAIAQAAVEQDDAATTNAFTAAYPDLQPAANDCGTRRARR